MKMMSWKLALAARLLSVGGLAWAGVIPYTVNGDALVFDEDYGAAGLTWTADANLFKTQYDADNTVVAQIITAVPTVADSYYGSHSVVAGDFNTTNGRMTWWGATAWAEWLGIIGYGGANDWGLWSALNSDGTGTCGPAYNCIDSALGHLFYTEGGLIAPASITSSATLSADFTNLQNYVYWSGTEYAPNPNNAWNFNTDNGNQNNDNKDNQNYGWAARPRE